MRSGREDKFRGAIDRMAGRIMQFFGKLSGNRKTSAKGKAARGRGGVRTTRGHLKRRAG
jgi:uncharacterized protein YjbJ (UPF0337 family)